MQAWQWIRRTLSRKTPVGGRDSNFGVEGNFFPVCFPQTENHTLDKLFAFLTPLHDEINFVLSTFPNDAIVYYRLDSDRF